MRFRALILALACAQIALTQQASWAQTAVQPTPEALSSVYRCAEQQDNAARLACYDETIDRLRQAETQGQIVALDRTRVESLQRESFGFSLPNFARLVPGAGGNDSALELVEVRIERINNRARGLHSFVTSNGQTWTQVEAQRISNVHVGDTVTIRQGALGTFMLSPPVGAGHRVRREN